MGRSTNYTAPAFPLMQRYCMGAHTGPAGISSFNTAVTAGFTAEQQWSRSATGYHKSDKQEKCGTSNREWAPAAELRANINMRVLRVQRCAGKKVCVPVELKERVFCAFVESKYRF